MEMPVPSESGSYAQHIDPDALEPTLLALEKEFGISDFHRMKFTSWLEEKERTLQRASMAVLAESCGIRKTRFGRSSLPSFS